ncbi:MAG TPA: protein kinase [Gemmatimonadaceae bacterium]|nr:protein kinase [Gemmatimonadaceae bacterium]
MTDLRATLERTLGDTYSVERELHGGAMSRVFVVMDRQHGREVVVKVLAAEVAAGVSAERFRREIQIAARLQHPHIVPVLSSGETGGAPFYTMPFVEGESLRARLARVGELPVEETVRILREVASALSYAHKQGVVHRDIKPDNIMISNDFALVTDFGVSKAMSESATNPQSSTLTGLGVALGTPAYMSPEQAAADPAADHRTDIYAFGVMAYEMLTGSLPFAARSTQAMMAAHAVDKPEAVERRRPGIPRALAALVMRCLEKRPADRPQSASDLLQILGDPKLHDRRAVGTAASGWRSPRVLAALAAVIAVVGALAVVGRQRGLPDQPRGVVGELSSVAVLPLVNVGGDAKDEYFSDGMTDELANALGKLPGLRVASRTSAYAFKGKKDIDVAEIGRKLRVQAILEGTVRRSGDQLRVGAQLTNVSDGLSMWSDTYQRSTKDIFSVQDDIARSIADALKLKLGGKAGELSSMSRGTESLAAYDSYLRGGYFWNRRGTSNLLKAVSYFEESIKRDPLFARAHAALALTYALLPGDTDNPGLDVLKKTRAAALRALALDSTLAEAHTALGLALVQAWDFKAADLAYRKAVALDPRYPTAHQWYGELLYHTGQIDSSLVELRRAANLDPLAPIMPVALGYALLLAGRFDEAIAEFSKAEELAPGMDYPRQLTAQAHLEGGQVQKGVEEMEAAAGQDSRALTKGKLCHAYGVAGRRADAERVLMEMKARAARERVSSVALAICDLGLGNRSGALAAMETAVKTRELELLFFSPLLDRTWDPLRGDPRWNRILRGMNLADYPAARQPR